MQWSLTHIIEILSGILVFSIVCFLLLRMLRRNEALKYEFVTIIAHKFRTPLTRSKWIIEDLVKDEPDPFRKQNIVELKKANENLVKMLGTMLELTDGPDMQRTSYKLERINLCDLVQVCYESTKNTFQEKNISVTFEYAEPAVFVKADRSRLEFVLLTLLENACLYTPTGRNVAVIVTTKRNKTALSVVDDGIGIDPHDMPHIFSRFFRAKNASAMDTEGLGVGLYLARSIVERHRGKLEAFSAGVDAGSTFSIILPRIK